MIPLDLWIETNHACNFTCSFCYNNFNPEAKGTLTTTRLSDTLTVLSKKFEIRTAVLAGGEPFLLKYLTELVRITKQYTQNITIITNGSLMTPTSLFKVIHAGVTHIHFSIHSLDKKSYNANTNGVDTFSETLSRIRHTRWLPIYRTAVYVVRSNNIFDLPKLIKILKFSKINQVLLNVERENSNDINTRTVEIQNSLAEGILQNERFIEKGKITIYISTKFPNSLVAKLSKMNNVKFSNSKFNRIIVDPTGDLRTCVASSGKYSIDLFHNSINPVDTINRIKKSENCHCKIDL